MPAKAGIHLRFGWQAKENLDSGLRRNDERKSRLLVDAFRTPLLGAEGHSVVSSRSSRVGTDSQRKSSTLLSVMPVKTGIQVTDSVRHTVEERYPG